jgi:hypothetical protein
VVSALYSAMSVGPIALLAALVAVPVYYLFYHFAPEPKKKLSLVRYVLVTLGVGALAYVVGTVVGISVACSSENSGNLCGLAGVFGVGPLMSAVAIFFYAHSWSRNARGG